MLIGSGTIRTGISLSEIQAHGAVLGVFLCPKKGPCGAASSEVGRFLYPVRLTSHGPLLLLSLSRAEAFPKNRSTKQ